jgi:hypothetical protein
MSLQFSIPAKSRYILINKRITASYNYPTLGKYNFARSEAFLPAAVTPAADTIQLAGIWKTGDVVVLSSSLTMPGGVAQNIEYYVVSAVPAFPGTIIKISATENGAAVDITSAGTGNLSIGAVFPVIPLLKNNIYLIERINLGATMPEEDFLSAINTLPQVVFKFKQDSQIVYPLPLPLVNYIDNQEANAFFWSEREGDALYFEPSGILNPVPSLVGVDSVDINLQLIIYEINDNDFSQRFKESNVYGNSGAGLSARPLSNVFYQAKGGRR